MSEPRRTAAAPPSGVDVFADSCRWVADAHLADDPEQIVAALCEMYRVLARQGWAPPEKASILLHLHTAAVDVALAQLVEPSARD